MHLVAIIRPTPYVSVFLCTRGVISGKRDFNS